MAETIENLEPCPVCETQVPTSSLVFQQINPKRLELVKALSSGKYKTYGAAAAAVGYHPSHVSRLIRKQEVVTALTRAREKELDKASGLLKKGRSLLRRAADLAADSREAMELTQVGAALVRLAKDYNLDEHATDTEASREAYDASAARIIALTLRAGSNMDRYCRIARKLRKSFRHTQ